MSFITKIERRGRNIVGTSPLEDLLLTVLFSSLGLVESLKVTVVALIESVTLVVRNPE